MSVTFKINDKTVNDLYVNDKRVDSLKDSSGKAIYARTETKTDTYTRTSNIGGSNNNWVNIGSLTLKTYCLESLNVILRPIISTSEGSWYYQVFLTDSNNNKTILEQFTRQSTCHWNGKNYDEENSVVYWHNGSEVFVYCNDDRYVGDPWYGCKLVMDKIDRNYSISGCLINRNNPDTTVTITHRVYLHMRTGSTSGGDYQWPGILSNSWIKYNAVYNYSLKE